jgi:hypothetical protein
MEALCGGVKRQHAKMSSFSCRPLLSLPAQPDWAGDPHVLQLHKRNVTFWGRRGGEEAEHGLQSSLK